VLRRNSRTNNASVTGTPIGMNVICSRVAGENCDGYRRRGKRTPASARPSASRIVSQI
jgi:ribosomal protein S11